VGYAVFLFLNIAPQVLLATVGIILFTRHRNIATALIACGFLTVLGSHIANEFANYTVSYVYRSSGAVAAANVTFRGVAWTVAHWSGMVGIWMASLGFVWYILDTRNRRVP
jgi:hypothetical protein